MLSWLFKEKEKTLFQHFENEQTKNIKILGIIFKIRKINPLDYLDGSSTVKTAYETYQVSSDKEKPMTEGTIKKIKAHYADVILAGVVDPVVSRKDDGTGMWVENMFSDWQLVGDLYAEIMLFTHGKKKLIQ